MAWVQRNSRVTANKSSKGNNSIFRSSTRISSCAVVKRGLQPLRGVGRVMKAVLALPLVNGAFTHAITQRQSCRGLRTGRHLSTCGGRSACVLIQGNHHDKAPGWTAVVTQRLSINCRMTSLAMNSGYRFESMQSSGMRQIATALCSFTYFFNSADLKKKSTV